MARRDDLATMLATPDARRVWWQEMEALGLFSVSLVPDTTGSIDLARTAFQEGRRSIALDRLAEARHLAPDLFRQVMLEHLAPVAKKEKHDE